MILTTTLGVLQLDALLLHCIIRLEEMFYYNEGANRGWDGCQELGCKRMDGYERQNREIGLGCETTQIYVWVLATFAQNPTVAPGTGVDVILFIYRVYAGRAQL